MIQATLFRIENCATMLTTSLGNDRLSKVIHKIAFAALSLIAHVFEWIDYAMTKNTHLLSKTLFIGLFSSNLQEIRMQLLLASSQDRSEVFSEKQFRAIWEKHIEQPVQDFEGRSIAFLKEEDSILFNPQAKKDIHRCIIHLKNDKTGLVEIFKPSLSTETTTIPLRKKMTEFFQKEEDDPKIKTLISLAFNHIDQALGAPPLMAMTFPSPYLSPNYLHETVDYRFYLHIQEEETLFFEMGLAITPYTFINDAEPGLGKKYIPVKFETKLGFKISCDDTHGKISDVSYTTTKSTYLHQA